MEVRFLPRGPHAKTTLTVVFACGPLGSIVLLHDAWKLVVVD